MVISNICSLGQNLLKKHKRLHMSFFCIIFVAVIGINSQNVILMKRFKLLFVMLAMVASTMLAWADDSGTCGDNLTWYFNSTTGALTIEGTGSMSNFSDYNAVPWSSYRASITTLNLPEGLTYIGNDAFNSLAVTSVTIPASVTSIGDAAFYHCENLSSVNFAASGSQLTSIGIQCFGDCPSLQSITLPEGIEVIGHSAFRYCEALNTIVLPNSLTTIQDEAFFQCSGLSSITIPGSVTSIGKQVFYDCHILTTLEMLPVEAPTVGSGLFDYGDQLKLIIICPCDGKDSYITKWSEYADSLVICPLTTIDEIYDAAASTYSLKNFQCNNWVVSGVYTLTTTHDYDCAFITDGENGFLLNLDALSPYTSPLTLSVGDKLNGLWAKAKVKKTNYQNLEIDINAPAVNIYQLTVTHDGVVTPRVKTINQLSGKNTGAPVTIRSLRCTEISGGAATMSDGTNTIIVAARLFDDALDYLEEGKYYDITGIFQSWKSGNPHRIYPRSAADIVELTHYEAEVTTASSVTTSYYHVEEAVAALEENSTLKLLAPVEISERIVITTTCTLDLNGYGIKSSGDHEVFFLNTHGGTFTLDDSNTGNQTHRYKQNPEDVFAELNETEGEIVLSGGYITSGRGNKTETVSGARDGGAFFVLETTFVMNGGNIIGNYTKRHGAGVFIAKGSHFIMNGGRITHNYANLAGAVSVYATTSDINDNASSTMEMHGGEISYNYARYNSGGIHSNSASVSMYATITIDGGSIINNHVSGSVNQHCGGIGVGGYSQIHISGNPIIFGNTFGDVVENIYIYSGSTLLIDGPLTNTTPLPITLESSGVFTSGLAGNGTKANFTMENTGMYLVTNSSGEAAILGPKGVTANQDPKKPGDYYSTFYHSQFKYILPAGVEAYAAEVNGGDLILMPIAGASDVLPYGTAVILKATGSALELIPTDEDPITITATNNLLGVDVDTPVSSAVTSGTCYVLSGHSSDYSTQEVGFYTYSGTLKANKAYLVVPPGASSAPQHLRFVFDAATDVESVQPSVISSQKIIRDGQLIILRNGVEYNANGQIIK